MISTEKFMRKVEYRKFKRESKQRKFAQMMFNIGYYKCHSYPFEFM